MGDIALRGQGRAMYAKGGRTHVTKEGKTARKGLWYNIAQKKIGTFRLDVQHRS
jgi:hypothetical protein